MYSEWNDLVLGAKGGDVVLKEKILERLYPLIISSIKHYYNRRKIFEDLIADGNLCILGCINDFNPQKGVYFLGFVKAQLKYLYLNKNRDRIHLSLNSKVGDAENTAEWIDLIPSDEEEQSDRIVREETVKDTIEGLETALSSLTDRQKEIVILFYVKRKSMQQIADSLEVSYRTIVNTKTRAIEKMRASMGR